MRKRVIIFDDDDEAILDVLHLVLSGAGYDIMMSNNSNHVIADVDKFQPDIILMDHQIPSIGGFEAVRLIKKHNQFCNIPVLFVSASKDIKRFTEDSGADDYIKKPFDIDYLEKKIAHYIV